MTHIWHKELARYGAPAAVVSSGFEGFNILPILMDGRAVAELLEESLKPRVHALKEAGHESPTLATILVGSDPASATYVGRKGDACRRVGMKSLSITLPETTTTAELLRVIDERQCFDRIALDKDVDGVTSQGFGLMAMGERAYGSATPAGIMRLLAHYDILLAGREAVVVGRSPILGKPMAQMLLNANATVTVCHSQTKDLDKVIQRADIVVGALGKPEFIKGAWIRDGAVVVDAGAHPNKVGDIELATVVDRSFAYTPVPGGVGPMTIATLIAQTLDAAERKSSRLYAR